MVIYLDMTRWTVKMAMVGLVLCVIALGVPCAEAQTSGLDGMLGSFISQGQSPDQLLAEKIVAEIAKDPAGAYKVIIASAAREAANDDTLAVYIWALGFTRRPEAAVDISEYLRKPHGLRVRINAWTALAQIATKKAGSVLADELASTKNREERSYILWKMAQMRYKPALSLGKELLKLDPAKDIWRSIFLYANFEKEALPELEKSLTSANRNERYSSVLLLGNWLVYTESARALEKAFSKEPDPVIRRAIVGALERVASDRAALEEFMSKVAKKDPAEEVRVFVDEYLERTKQIKSGIFAAGSSKSIDRDAFQREFEGLYKTAGTVGDYDALRKASGVLDEYDLLLLRRKILLREDDSALDDYQKINEIIITNRLIDYYSGR